MWNGKGDFMELAGGSRGFQKTSLSILLYIQPHPLLSEMTHLTGVDGFMDRFLFVVSRPVLFSTTIVKENYSKLQEHNVVDFVSMYERLFEDHKCGKTYILSKEAQNEYDDLVDSFAEYLNDKYQAEEIEEDKENTGIPSTQTNLCMTRSKDTLHVIRLAVLLHITEGYLRMVLSPTEHAQPPSLEVSRRTFNNARKLYSVMAKQKSAFVQTVNNMQKTETVKIKKVQTFKDRLVRAVLCSCGPIVTLRDLQRNLKGSLKDSIIHEREVLEREGFGLLKKCGKANRHVFLKTSPSQMLELDILDKCGLKEEDYRLKFLNTEKIDKRALLLCLPSHPQHDEIIEWFPL